MIITIQGPIGCGKTTIINILKDAGYTAFLIESKPSKEECIEVWSVESSILPYPRKQSEMLRLFPLFRRKKLRR